MIKGYTDEEIIALLQSPSKVTRDDIISKLFVDRQLKSKVFATINKMIKDDTVLEGIRLDSLLLFAHKVRNREFKGNSTLTTYYIGFCKIKSLQHIDKEKRNREKGHHYRADQLLETDHHQDAEFELLSGRRYQASLKRRIFEQLSEKCQQYFQQKFKLSMSTKEIAAANKIKNHSVSNAMTRCYILMREIILNDAEVMEQIRLNYGKL